MPQAQWIDEMVKRFRKGCEELQSELGRAANGTFLDVSDEQILHKLEPLLREVQQKAVQTAIEKGQVDPDYRRCTKCKKK